MSTEILEQSPLYRMWIAEAVERGRAEGEVEGLRQATHTALVGRWQSLPAEIEAALATASLAILNDILTHIAADTLEQVHARLGLA